MLARYLSGARKPVVGSTLSPDDVHAPVQRRTLRLLFFTQIISGVGLAIGASVGALLAADLAGVAMSGLAQSAHVVGAALFAIPLTALVRRHGRRHSLTTAYVAAALGGFTIVAAATAGRVPFVFAGLFLMGGATAAGLQARYAAVDLAPPARRGRHLSIVVWATTLGAVAGPNLAPFAGAAVSDYGIPPLAGPFFFSAVLFLVAAALLTLFLRPDPAVLARAAVGLEPPPAGGDGMAAALRSVIRLPDAVVGIAAVAVGHLVMVGVMAMTPVHISGAGHDAAHTLRLVGFVLSVHIAGMFAFAPVMGWLADRMGRRVVIAGGLLVLMLACAIAGTAGHHTPRLATGLLLLGLGWSGTMVAGSTLLSEAAPTSLRASVQGLSDLLMGLAGATAGALSGVVVQLWGYPALTAAAAVCTLPLLLALPGQRRSVPMTMP
jgi:MFS family permease